MTETVRVKDSFHHMSGIELAGLTGQTSAPIGYVAMVDFPEYDGPVPVLSHWLEKA